MKREYDNAQMESILDQIKRDPSSFIPTEGELKEVIEIREAADRRLKEEGRIVILTEQWQTE